MPTTDQLWFMYAQQIIKTAAPLFDPASSQFSIASTTLSLDIGNPDAQVINGYIYNLGNVIPAASPTYSPNSFLMTSYQAFLDAIDLKGDSNPNLDSQITVASQEMTAAQSNFIAVQSSAVAAWTTYKAINPNISFSDYVTSQYTIYLQAKNSLAGSTAKFQQLMTQKYGIGYEIIAQARNVLSATGGASDITMPNSYNMAIKTGATAAVGSVPSLPGQTPLPPSNQLVSSYAPAFSLLGGVASVYAGWQQASANGAKPAVSVHIDDSSSSSVWQNLGWASESTGFFSGDFLDFFGESSSSSNTQTQFSTTGKFSIQIDFVGLNCFPIAPGAWFNLGLIRTYKNQLLPNSPSFFAPGGPLARIPAQAVVGFNPTITLTLSQSDFASLKSHAQSQSTVALGFGPFVIGETHSSSYADKTAMAFDDSNARIIISPPKTTVPLLLGVISSRLDV